MCRVSRSVTSFGIAEKRSSSTRFSCLASRIRQSRTHSRRCHCCCSSSVLCASTFRLGLYYVAATCRNTLDNSQIVQTFFVVIVQRWFVKRFRLSFNYFCCDSFSLYFTSFILFRCPLGHKFRWHPKQP